MFPFFSIFFIIGWGVPILMTTAWAITTSILTNFLSLFRNLFYHWMGSTFFNDNSLGNYHWHFNNFLCFFQYLFYYWMGSTREWQSLIGILTNFCLSFSIYFVIGWGVPVLMTTAWAITTGILTNSHCWFGYSHTLYYWIVEGPRLTLIAVRKYSISLSELPKSSQQPITKRILQSTRDRWTLGMIETLAFSSQKSIHSIMLNLKCMTYNKGLVYIFSIRTMTENHAKVCMR